MNNPVLPSLKPIIEDSKYVRVNKEKIRETAREIGKNDFPIPSWREPVFIARDLTWTIDFFFLGNTINFAYADFDSGEKFETYYQDQKYSGAFAMWASLKRAFESKIPILDPRFLQQIERRDMRNIFIGNIEIPLLDERTAIFQEVGSVLLKKYKGRFYNLVEESNYKAFDGGNGTVERLVKNFPSFNDVAYFNGAELKFYKRAQLAVAMTYGRLKDTDLFPIQDIDSLTVFADYSLPVSLKALGILKYEKSLEERIAKKELIQKDSREELEIRANTICAGDLLIKEINNHRAKDNQINALHIDYWLWSQRRKSKGQHHLTKTIAY